MPSPLLYFAGARLSIAELTAARLDGHLCEVGPAYVAADTVETPALRAGSLYSLTGAGLAVTHLSAAWVHELSLSEPGRHTLQRATPTRPHLSSGPDFDYRDPFVPEHDRVMIGGVWVTTPVRTLADLLRVPSRAYRSVALRALRARPDLVDGVRDWLENTHWVPHKRTALGLLRQSAN